MRDAANASELIDIAHKNMENWYKTYFEATKAFHKKYIPEYICPNIEVPLQSMAHIEMQITKVSWLRGLILLLLHNHFFTFCKIRDCHREKAEQLDVLKGIADKMYALDQLESVKTLEDTIENLNKTIFAENIVLEKEEKEVLQLKDGIDNFKCDCGYGEWGNWTQCSKTCGDDGIKSRQRDVEWEPRNGGKECTDADQTETTSCNRNCCRKFDSYLMLGKYDNNNL